MASAAAVTLAEAFGLVSGVLLPVVGLRGNGGGARSGSELSHLLSRLATKLSSSRNRCMRTWVLMSGLTLRRMTGA
jgi:hypothetical protein